MKTIKFIRGARVAGVEFKPGAIETFSKSFADELIRDNKAVAVADESKPVTETKDQPAPAGKRKTRG